MQEIVVNAMKLVIMIAYLSAIGDGIRKIHGAKTAVDVAQVYLPGEWIETGISIPVDHLWSLVNIAEKLNIDISWEK